MKQQALATDRTQKNERKKKLNKREVSILFLPFFLACLLTHLETRHHVIDVIAIQCRFYPR